jgi:hypothetical protein
MDRTAPPTSDPEGAIGYLEQLTPDLRGAAILDRSGEVLASSGVEADWKKAAGRLFSAADDARGSPASHVHVATEEGEVFGVREGDLTMVSVTGRFPLASLMVFDMRTVLRGLSA